MLTIFAVAAVDILTAVFTLGLLLGRPVTPPLPRRVPGAALVLDVPADSVPFTAATVAQSYSAALPYVPLTQTIGERARQRRDAVRDYYEQKAGGW